MNIPLDPPSKGDSLVLCDGLVPVLYPYTWRYYMLTAIHLRHPLRFQVDPKPRTDFPLLKGDNGASLDALNPDPGLFRERRSVLRFKPIRPKKTGMTWVGALSGLGAMGWCCRRGDCLPGNTAPQSGGMEAWTHGCTRIYKDEHPPWSPFKGGESGGTSNRSAAGFVEHLHLQVNAPCRAHKQKAENGLSPFSALLRKVRNYREGV